MVDGLKGWDGWVGSKEAKGLRNNELSKNTSNIK